MKILMLPAYFEPENVAGSHLSDALLDEILNEGFDVELYAPSPTRGITDEVRKIYKRKKHEVRCGGKLQIHRFGMMKEKRNPVQRVIRYTLINVVQFFKAISAKSIDVLFVASTPPTQGAMAALVKKIKRVPLVYNLQDIFPDSLANAGMTREGSLLWIIGRKIEDYIYKNADKIIVISHDFKRNIMEKGVPEDKIDVIFNWVDTALVRPIPRADNQLLNELQLPRDKFYVTYAGNLGESQGINVILEAAKKLQNQTEIAFVLFGGGSLYSHYQIKLRALELSNLHLFPLMPYDRVSEVYSLGDVSIVSCKKGVGNGALPSKTWSIMGSGTPILASFDLNTELEHILEKHDCGKLVEAENAELLSEQILWFYRHPEQTVRMGKNARECVVNQFSKDNCVGLYVEALRSTIEQKETNHLK